MFLCYTVVLFRLLYFVHASNELYVNYTPIKDHEEKYRGDLLDRNSTVIASTVPIFSLFLDADYFCNKNIIRDSCVRLNDVFGRLNCDGLCHHKRHHQWFRAVSYVTPKELDIINGLDIIGIRIDSLTKRLYPQGDLFSHVVGSTGDSEHGIMGIELSLDQRLSHHESIQLTLDTNIQYIVYTELKSAIKYNNANGGFAIVADVASGEILGAAAFPNFNPNNLHSVNDKNAFFNRNTLGVYEFGSIMKLFTIASALDSKSVTLMDTFDVSRNMTIDNHVIHDYHKMHNSEMSVQDILSRSSNIGIAKIALKMGSKIYEDYLHRFGFYNVVNIPFKEIGFPILPKEIGMLKLATMAYGYGLSITPMHLIQAAIALFNGGFFVPLKILRDENPSLRHRILSNETSNAILDISRKIVIRGTGFKANALGYPVGGKTGSAEKITSDGYDRNKNLDSFLAVFPTNYPKYVILVTIDSPNNDNGKNTAGFVVAPVIKHIVQRIAAIKAMQPS